MTAALRAAELGASVALLERDVLGGTCTNDGCAPTRVLAKAARLLRDAQQLGDYGISAVAPRIDLSALLRSAERTVEALHAKKDMAAHLRRAGVQVVERAGHVGFASPTEVVLGDGSTLTADRFVIACGGHARRLAFPGAEMALTHHDVWRMAAVPASLAIVGAAATGAQLASVFAAFGSQVTLLDLAPRILPQEDPDISASVAAAFAGQGITVVTGIDGVDHIERSEARLSLAYRHQGQVRGLSAETVIVAAGWPGNVESLRLEAAGVDTERGYIRVDDTLRTSAPGIWAAGDITGRMMLVQSATLEGRTAAENAVRGDGRAALHPIVAHGGFTDPEYASVGITEGQATAAGEAVVVGMVPYADLDRAVIDGRTGGFCKLIVSRDDRRLLGAHVVGEQAVEVIQIAATAMAGRIGIQRLAEVELAYPTFTSIVALAARQVVHALRLPADEAHAWESLGRPRVSEWERRAI